jgi:effector-binding domain-containing protein
MQFALAAGSREIPMRTLRHALVAILVGVGALTLMAFLLPDHLHVERSASIEVPADVLYSLLNSPQRYKQFYPSYSASTPLVEALSGPATGVGARAIWTTAHSPIAIGDHLIIASEPNRLVRLAVRYRDEGQGVTTWQISEDGERSGLIWSFETSFGSNPYFRYRGLWLRADIEHFLDGGVVRLKKYAEETAKRLAAFAAGPRLVDVPASDRIAVHVVVRGPRDAPAAAARAYDKLRKFASEHELLIEGAPIAATNFSDSARIDFDALLSVSGSPASLIAARAAAAAADVAVERSESTRAVRVVHLGPETTDSESLNAAIEYAQLHELTPVGRSWLEYVTDPLTPAEDRVTNVYLPVTESVRAPANSGGDALKSRTHRRGPRT